MREEIINRCFQKADMNNDDIITIADLRYCIKISRVLSSKWISFDSFLLKHILRQSYSVEDHPLYKNGDEDKEQIMVRFLATFEEGDNLLAEVCFTNQSKKNYFSMAEH